MATMKSMVLNSPGRPLEECELPVPEPSKNEVLVKVTACGVCRTDLHVRDGELPQAVSPVVPGHEIVGIVEKVGNAVTELVSGERVCIPWLGGVCGLCYYCKSDRENLCDNPVFTGCSRNGGFAEYTLADADFCFPAPESYSDLELAPLLCAGLIGWRSYKFAVSEQAKALGVYGFGAAAHILTQVAKAKGKEIYAFVRPGDEAAKSFALEQGAVWAGASDQMPPQELDAAIIFAPVGNLVPLALKACRKGGIVVLGGIHMSDIPSFPYEILWNERSLKSVANLTRDDAREFLKLAPAIPVRTTAIEYPLHRAEAALEDLRNGNFSGAAVLIP